MRSSALTFALIPGNDPQNLILLMLSFCKPTGIIMVFFWQSRAIIGMTALTLFGVGAIGATGPSVQVAAQTSPSPAASFPDIQGHWAQPFIERLADSGILTGYLDNTFRPDRPVARDEFAAMIRQAFNQPTEQQIASGSVYEDVPEGYWAAPAIEEAAEMGFVSADPNGNFRPDGSVSRAEVLSSLAGNLNLSEASNGTPTSTPSVDPAAPPDPAIQPATQPAAPQPVRQVRRQRFMYPMAMTMLMQPIMGTPRNVRSTPPSPAPSNAPADPETAANQSPAAAPSPNASAQPPTEVVRQYYQDAAQIPPNAVDPIAAATTSQIVVNYPDRQVLNPNQPATRGETAAFIHQALVQQGRLTPLPNDNPAAGYVIAP